MATELEKIAERITARGKIEHADRKRQRELIRKRISEGSTWSEVEHEARVSRATIRAALNRTD